MASWVLDRPGDRNAAIQLLEGLPLTAHPERALELAPVAGLLLEGDAHAPLLDELAVSVQRLVAEVSTVQRVIELQGDQLFAGRPRVRPEQVDTRFLAVLERFEMGFDESFVEEVLERFVSQRVLLLIGVRTCGNRDPEEREPELGATGGTRRREDGGNGRGHERIPPSGRTASEERSRCRRSVPPIRPVVAFRRRVSEGGSSVRRRTGGCASRRGIPRRREAPPARAR